MTLDFSQCLVKAYNFGETVVTNVCTGTKAIVPWGSMDYIGPVTWLTVGALIIVLFARIATAEVKVRKSLK